MIVEHFFNGLFSFDKTVMFQIGYFFWVKTENLKKNKETWTKKPSDASACIRYVKV